jgi:hypothetical protein
MIVSIVPHVSECGIMETSFSQTEDNEARRRKARTAGLKLLIAGILMPPAYVFASLKTFGHLKTVPAIIAFTVAAVCLTLGAWALIRTRR